MITRPLNSLEIVHYLPNSTYLVETPVGTVLVNCPPETLKCLLALGYRPPQIILISPDMLANQQLGSSGFVRQGINYASVEFLLYSNFFGGGRQRTRIITTTTNQAKRLHQILEETVVGPRDSKPYGHAQWLKRECESVGTFPPLGRPPGPNDLCEIVSLDQQGGNLGEGITIQQEDDQFIFLNKGERFATIPSTINKPARPMMLAPARPLQRHELTLQFIGGSDGFDPAGITTCFLAYLSSDKKTQATLFDCAAYLRIRLGNLGLSAHQISEVVLSHLHEDHLAGLPELLLMGEHRVRLLTSDIIYQSLLRVLSAMLALPASEVATLFDYLPLNPGNPITIEGRRFESIYAVHSIPTLAVRANTLYYSGDMRYDEQWFDELVTQGVLSSARRDSLIHFADGASILVQDAGGGAIHTTITPELLKALAAKGQRVILAHTSKHKLPVDDPTWDGQVEFAGSGHITTVGEAMESIEDVERLETLAASPLFSRLPLEMRIELAQQAGLSIWPSEHIIIQSGEPANGHIYIVHSGLVEVGVEGQSARVEGRGYTLGARGGLLGGTRSFSLTARGTVQLLSLSPDVFKKAANKLGLSAVTARAQWLEKQPLFKDLLWATLLDLALDFQPRTLKANDWLFRYGEPGVEFFMLVSGALTILDKDGQFLGEANTPGEFFGGRAALYGTLRNASAHATTDTEVWALPAATLQRLQMVYPNIMMHLRAVESVRNGSPRRADDSATTA